jgi:hypothetical protein
MGEHGSFFEKLASLGIHVKGKVSAGGQIVEGDKTVVSPVTPPESQPGHLVNDIVISEPTSPVESDAISTVSAPETPILATSSQPDSDPVLAGLKKLEASVIDPLDGTRPKKQTEIPENTGDPVVDALSRMLKSVKTFD